MRLCRSDMSPCETPCERMSPIRPSGIREGVGGRLNEGEPWGEIDLNEFLTSSSMLEKLLRRTRIEFELRMFPSESTTGFVSVPPEKLPRRTRAAEEGEPSIGPSKGLCSSMLEKLPRRCRDPVWGEGVIACKKSVVKVMPGVVTMSGVYECEKGILVRNESSLLMLPRRSR